MSDDTVYVRNATDQDTKDLWTWSNDFVTRRNSISKDEISWQSHTDWFEKSQQNENRVILIAVDRQSAEKIGMVRFDTDGDGGAVVSINLNPSWRARGMSSRLLNLAIEAFSQENQCVLTANIKPDNLPSLKCFQRCGFSMHEETQDLLVLKKQKN